MDDEPWSQGPSGWSFLKVLGVILGLIGMVGFGICTLCGIGFSGPSGLSGWILSGAFMFAMSMWLVLAMFRKARQEREDANRNGP